MGRFAGWITTGTGVLIGAVVALVLVLSAVPDPPSTSTGLGLGLAASPASSSLTSAVSSTSGHLCHGPLERDADHVSAGVPSRPGSPAQPMTVPERLPDAAPTYVARDDDPFRCCGASFAAPSLAALQVLRI